MAVRPHKLRCARHGERRRLRFEPLEERRLLSLSHLYTFNDGLANDWIGSAHATLFNGATIAGGQLHLNNNGVTSGQSGVVQYARLGANVLSSGDATVEVWFTAANSSDFTRVFDIGSSLAGVGNTYLSFNIEDGSGNSHGLFRAAGASEISVSGPALDDGMEHMVAIVLDTAADLMRLYIDGNEIGTNNLGGATAGGINDALAYLGRSLFDADPGFTGSINELRIYDDARSATDIAADAASGPSTATKSPLVRQMEYLDRGLVAVRTGTNSAYVGWRLLGTDPAGTTFNLYRSTAGGDPVKLNATPITSSTNFADTSVNFSLANSYFVRAIVGSIEQEPSKSFNLAALVATQQYLRVPLQPPPPATVQLPPGVAGDPGSHDYFYVANDASVGDLDGDGEYEIILKWDPFNPNDIDNPNNNPPRTGEGSSQDNSLAGFTGNVFVDAYKLDGTLLWRISLGKNIRAGAHYTQFMVYDLDGDGKAEVAMKTAPGSVDGKGNNIVLGADNPNADYRNSAGYILTGPEYLTVFNGETGAAMATVPYQPARGSVTQWGDSYGNRVDRFISGIAYLDGVRPSLIVGRGYYGPQSGGGQARNEVAAYDFRDGQLTLRWHFKAGLNINGNINSNYIGQGAHSLTIGDVDNDGKDEIIYGAAAIDDNGVGLYSTGLGHGDALHLSDFDPTRPGLEVFMVHESAGAYQSGGRNAGGEFRDARTGELIFGIPATSDVGRGVAGDIWAGTPGAEAWASGGGATNSLFSSSGTVVGRRPSTANFLVWWDADLTRELFDGQNSGNGTPRIDKYGLSSDTRLLNLTGSATSNSTKANPALIADVLGDWREEVIVRNTSSTELRIYTTTNVTTNRLYTLMHDSQYRVSIAAQNSAYNQPSHPSFFLGAGMAPPPVPQIYTVQAAPELPGDYNGDFIVDTADYTVWRNAFGGNYDPRADGNGDQMVNEADYAVWKQNYGNSSGGLTIVTNLPPAGAGSGQFASLLNESSIQDAALTQPSLPALLSPGESSISSTRTGGLPGSAAVIQPAAAADNNDLLFTLLDHQARKSQAMDAGSIAAHSETAPIQDELWAELGDILPHADWLRL